MNRRNFLLGAAVTLVAAPAIVRVASIMPVKAVELAVPPPEFMPPGITFHGVDAYGVRISEFVPWGGRSQKMFMKIYETHYAMPEYKPSFMAVGSDGVKMLRAEVARAC